MYLEKLGKKFTPIENVYHRAIPSCNCFACGPGHDLGFRLRFFLDAEAGEVVSELEEVRPDFAGFPGVLHGGFQAMLLDEAMCWAALGLAKRVVFTARLEVKFAGLMPTGGPALLTARITKPGSRLLSAEAEITVDGEVRSRATGSLYSPTARELPAMIGLETVPEELKPYLR